MAEKILQATGTSYFQGEFSSFHILLDLWKNISTFYVSLILLLSHSAGIFSCFAVLFICL